MTATGSGNGTFTGHLPRTSGYRRMLFGLFCAGIATFTQLYSPQGILPMISAEFSVTADRAALLVSAATLGLALAVIPWSLIGDRLGRKKAMGWSIVLASLFAVASIIAPTFEIMVAFRFIEGACLGGVPALAMAYLNEEVDKGYAAQTAGIYIAGTVVGGLLGRIVTAPIADFWHWRIGMAAVVVLAVLAAVGFLTISPVARRFTPSTTTVADVGRSLLKNLSSPQLIVTYMQGMLLMGGFVAIYNYLGFHLMEDPFSLPISVVSLLFLAYLTGTITSPRAGALATRYGPSKVLLTCISLMLIGVLVMLIDNLWVVLFGLILFTAAFFGAHSVASGLAGSAAVGGRAQSTALYNLGYYGGSSLFGWLGGVFLTYFAWPGTVLMTASLALMGGLLVVFVVVLPARRAASTGATDPSPEN